MVHKMTTPLHAPSTDLRQHGARRGAAAWHRGAQRAELRSAATDERHLLIPSGPPQIGCVLGV